MEHICFEVQLCSEILIFNENSNFWYTDHPEKSALILQSETRGSVLVLWVLFGNTPCVCFEESIGCVLGAFRKLGSAL